MKKIKIIESNNGFIEQNQAQIFTLESELSNELRAYVSERISLTGMNELQIFLNVMEWVHSQWTHDGMNDGRELTSLEILKRAHKGERFRFVEYGEVTQDVLLAFGYIARSIGLRSVESDYGGVGQGHVATEVWSNEFNKWIFLDPQVNCYAIKDETPLSYYEIYQSFHEVTFIFLGETEGDEDEVYRAFIKNYFGYMNVSASFQGENLGLFLYLDGHRQLLTFQGMDMSRGIFTERVESVYFNPNQTMILFEYQEPVHMNQVIQEHHLETVEAMLENYHLFYAKPNYRLKLMTNTPNFDYYEVIINNSAPVKLITDELKWNLEEGINCIEVCAVNQQGIRGSKTFMKIAYQ